MTAHSNRPDVYTVDECAERLRASRWTIYDEIKAGRIRVLRLGRAIRVPAVELDRLLAGEAVATS